MNLRILNQVTIALTFVGMYIAGSLSLSKLLDIALPCGAQHGCDIVTTSKYAMVGPVSVAYLGFFSYFVLCVIAIARCFTAAPQTKKLIYAAYGFSLVGTLVSAYLQYLSIYEIRQLCYWCLASASTMLVIFILQAFMANASDEAPELRMGGVKIAPVFLVLALAGLGYSEVSLKKAEKSGAPRQVDLNNFELADYVPKDAHSRGPEDSKVTIIEFGDLVCPACKQHYNDLVNMFDAVKGKLRFTYRHLPMVGLPEHHIAGKAAMVSEMCGEQGHFWDFVAAMYATTDPSKLNQEDLINLAKSVNCDASKFNDRLAHFETDPAYLRVQRDAEFAAKLKVVGTPTFVVIAEGMPTKAVSYTDLGKIFGDDNYLRIMGNR